MQGDAPQPPVTQVTQPEVNKAPQIPQQKPDVPQIPPASTEAPEAKKGSKAKKVVIFLILIPILGAIAYAVFLAATYWNCTKTTPKTCEENKCGFSPTGFSLTTEIKDSCCGNKTCEVGETSSDCTADCPSCDDASACTKDSYDYDGQQCSYEQLYAPCYLRIITLDPAIPETDYQININLTASDFDYSKAGKDGEDIRFSDENGKPLDYWIEDWNNEGGESSIWVKVGSVETNKIYMYYGHSDASSVSDGSAVFDFFDSFDYAGERELLKVWDKHDSPIIELSGGVVTISTSSTEEDEEHGGQHISQKIGTDILSNNIFEMNVKRFPGHHSHMANIGYTSSSGGPIGDGDTWVALRYSPSPDGSLVVFGGNHGSIASSPIGGFNTIKIYHQGGISYAYEPPGTKVAQYNWPMPLPQGDYVLLGGATTISGSGKASYDWIRVRKYASSEPSVTLRNEETASESSTIKNLYTDQ